MGAWYKVGGTQSGSKVPAKKICDKMQKEHQIKGQGRERNGGLAQVK